MTWTEDGIHRWLARRGPARGVVGRPGHDAAVLRALAGRPVICTDQTIEDVHFARRAAPRAVGRKAVARALSDLAATAARPRAVVVALAAPSDREEVWVRSVLAGAREAARAGGADLVGGDLAVTPGPATITATAIGDIEATAAPPSRARARVGQWVVVTGPLGGSLLGRHLSIEPRVAEGRWLRDCGATAMMDVSDGLAWDLHRLARTAGVRIDLDTAEIPVHSDAVRLAGRERGAGARSALWHALHDGEDHELVATLSRAALTRVLAQRTRRCRSLAVIGRVRRGRGLWVPDAKANAGWRRWSPEEGGWKHE